MLDVFFLSIGTNLLIDFYILLFIGILLLLYKIRDIIAFIDRKKLYKDIKKGICDISEIKEMHRIFP